jgi:hypothetical protein
MRGRTAYAEEGVPKAIGTFSSPDFVSLSDVQKLALYYWLKTMFNVRLAVDHERVFFSNLARTPLLSVSALIDGDAYEEIEGQERSVSRFRFPITL